MQWSEHVRGTGPKVFTEYARNVTENVRNVPKNVRKVTKMFEKVTKHFGGSRNL